MRIMKLDNGVILLTPDEGKRLTNGKIIFEKDQQIYLAKSEKPEDWYDIDEIVVSVWNVNKSILIPNPNGSPIKVNTDYDSDIDAGVIRVEYDTNNYSGGTIVRNVDGKFKKARLTYKSDNGVRIHLQYNDKAYNNYIVLSNTTGKYETVDIDINEEIKIDHFEFYISTENGDKAEGILYIKDLSLVD